MPGLAWSPTPPVRERPPSQYMTSAPPRSRILNEVMNASSSWRPRRTGNTPPWLKIQVRIPGLNSCDLAMNWIRRRMNAPMKKWSMNEAWLGARITGPLGTFSLAMPRARNAVSASAPVTARTTS